MLLKDGPAFQVCFYLERAIPGPQTHLNGSPRTPQKQTQTNFFLKSCLKMESDPSDLTQKLEIEVFLQRWVLHLSRAHGS